MPGNKGRDHTWMGICPERRHTLTKFYRKQTGLTVQRYFSGVITPYVSKVPYDWLGYRLLDV